MPNDHQGFALATTETAAAAYRRAVRPLTTPDPQGRHPAAADAAVGGLTSAVHADPGWSLARLTLLVALRATTGDRAPARTAAVHVGDPGNRPDRRERQHGDVLRAALAGDRSRAEALRLDHLARYPADALLEQLLALLGQGLDRTS